MRMPTILGLGSALLVLSACSAGTANIGGGHPPPDEDPARNVRLQLADAFDRKDSAAIRPVILDSWSGLRFCTNWSDENWKDAAKALREAKLKSSSPSADGAQRRVYTVVLRRPDRSQPREIVFEQHDGRWVLDYDSFMGPFPHM